MSDPVDFPGSAEAGISEADQRDIRAEIEKVAAQNRIKVSDDLLDYQPQRNGAVFPIIANVTGLVLLAAGLFAFFLIFQNDEAAIRSGDQSVAATESRLIQELRRETEAQLAEKEAEIEQIVARLESISEERAALAEDMEAQITQREQELQEQFQAELEAERRRLQNLNLSESEIEARLAEFEAEKRQEYNERLAAFQERMVAERQRLEEDLDSLEEQFSTTLEQASQERQAILQESEARISELQSEFRSQLAESEAELTEAQRELARLSQSQERETLLRGQITGLYRQISGNIQATNYDAALSNLTTLENLLNEPSVLQIDALREERGTNLFMVRTLRQYIQESRETNNPETIARLSDATLVRRASELREEADQALQNGNEELARTLYRQALQTIPAVAESFAYFESQGGGAATAQDAAAENEAALALIEDAQAAAGAGNLRDAIDEFAQAVQLYPNSIYRGRAVSGIQQSVDQLQSELGAEIESLQQEQAALRLAVEEQSTSNEGNLVELRRENDSLQNQIAQLESQVETLRDQRSALETQRETLRGQLSTLQEQRDDQQERAAQLQTQIRQLDEEVRRLEGVITERDQALAESRRSEALLREQLAAAAEGGTTDPAVLEELARLRSVEGDIAAAEELYAEYRNQAESLSANSDGVELVEAKLRLDEFLGAPELTQYFPELLSEVRRYESAYERSGRENAMVEISDLIYEISLLDSTSARLSRIRQERNATDQPLLRDFLDELELLLEG